MLRPILACTCNPTPACSSEVTRTVRENVSADLVMKFDKGLNDSFESVRLKVSLPLPLPDIKTTFNLAVNHKRQQTCNTNVSQVVLAQGSYNPAVTLAYMNQQQDQIAHIKVDKMRLLISM